MVWPSPGSKVMDLSVSHLLAGTLPRIRAGGEQREGKFDRTLPTGNTQTSVRFTSLDSRVKSLRYK